MSKDDPKSLSELISRPESAIGRLVKQARSKLQLTDHVRKGLPADFAAALIHCSVDDQQTLIVRAATPEWAARFRFDSERLLRLSREHEPATRHVKVCVAHPD